MRRRGSSIAWILGLWTLACLAFVAGLAPAAPALACSPPFDRTIAGQGPDPIVIVGTTGEPAPGGRLFHVERVYNGDVVQTPIVIAFKEGEPVGDCSYPMEAGRHLVIVPWLNEQGLPAADIATIQADPASPEGRALVAEAESLFGPGFVPPSVEPPPGADAPTTDLLLPAVGGVIAIGAAVLLLAAAVAAHRRSSRPTA